MNDEFEHHRYVKKSRYWAVGFKKQVSGSGSGYGIGNFFLDPDPAKSKIWIRIQNAS
jgi:hypothetical protein